MGPTPRSPIVAGSRNRPASSSWASSAAAAETVSRRPEVIGQTVAIDAPLSDDADLYLKGEISRDTPEDQRRLTNQQIDWLERLKADGAEPSYRGTFVGARRYVLDTFAGSKSAAAKKRAARFLTGAVCPACRGRRIKAEALSVTFEGLDITEISALPLHELRDLLLGWPDEISPVVREWARDDFLWIRRAAIIPR